MVRHPFSSRKRNKYRDRLKLQRGLSGSSDLEAAWYLIWNKDVLLARIDPRKHYLQFGKAEGRSWGLPEEAVLAQQAERYLMQNPDIAVKGVDALQHFIHTGSAEGRLWPFVDQSAEERAADALPWVRLLPFIVDPALAARPALNVLIPGVGLKHSTGGPNTAINLACRLAMTGVKVRLISTHDATDADPTGFWKHATLLSGADPRSFGVEMVDASKSERPISIGVNDLFMATAWWTAQAAKYAVRHMRQKRFLYLIQDYEPLLHPASTEQALALETYSLDHLPIINTRLLYDHLVEQRVGRFADPAFVSQALYFEPAVDRKLFYPDVPAHTTSRRKRLLMYARPQKGVRNLFELGVAALRQVIARGETNFDEWEFCGMGENFAPVYLGSGHLLKALPWKDLETYAQLMRESDVLLSLMHSPHPSYPPLEMAACGRPVVTSTFGSKNAARLGAISPNIIGVEPTLECVADGLAAAFRFGGVKDQIQFPKDWSESFAEILPRLHETCMVLQGAPTPTGSLEGIGQQPAIFPGFETWPSDAYGMYRQEMVAERKALYTDADPSLLSFITPVWNTAPQFLFELAYTVLGQDSGSNFEWVILDNGSDKAETREALKLIASHPAVRLERVDQNIGIVRALRSMLERAQNRYIVPLDSDDLITPDCVRIMTSALRNAGFPKLAYSDEDKRLEEHQRDPYSKPDWDPVLFTHSCYIAHLCAIDRQTALELGCYTNHDADGSTDWDSFTRFLLAGHTPLHIPELLYTWRMHPQSTALAIDSKSYIHDSQKSVLYMFLRGREADTRYTVELSPLFSNTPDWRFVRTPQGPRPITTLLLGPGADRSSLAPSFTGHRIEKIETPDLSVLLEHAKQAASEGRLLHLLSTDVSVEDERWPDEALAMFELYPDTVVVGGRIIKDGVLVAADAYFGFNGACGSPNLGKSTADPGYFAQLWKPHSASVVPVQHSVIDAKFLVEALPALIRAEATYDALSMWLGAAARRRKQRCVYTPFFSASTHKPVKEPSSTEIAALTIAFGDVIPDCALLSPRLGLTLQTAYQPVSRQTRATQEKTARTPVEQSYPERHAADLMARRLTAAPPAIEQADLSVFTTVYINTDAALFRATAAALLAQTLPFREWLILAHGPILQDLDAVLDDLSHDSRIRILRRGTNLGIIGGMRLCLEEARARYCVPLDADDLVTTDALQMVMATFSGADNVSFLFSDEDILFEGNLQSPIRRTPFDPILNDADSTIWHLCAFARERALQLGVYSDSGAEFCHDWDTVHRFSQAGETLVHIPHVLYHWRHHARSTSHSGTLNEGSLNSVRHVLSGIQARQADPSLYEIVPYPINRGVEQISLQRKKVSPIPLCLISFVRSKTSALASEEAAALPAAEIRVIDLHNDDVFDPEGIVQILLEVTSEHFILLDERLRPSNPDGPWEVMQMFELHKNVAAVSGRVIDSRGNVAAVCQTLSGGSAQWIGHPRTFPGEQALALKPQTATGLINGYAYCRREVLEVAVSACVMPISLQEFGRRIVEATEALGMRLAYSPLCETQYAN